MNSINLNWLDRDMSFGVVICRKCKRASGVNLQFKTSTCPYCNNKMKIDRKDLKFKSNSEKELVTLISNINKQLQEKHNEDHQTSYPDIGESILNLDYKSNLIKELNNKKKIYEHLDPIKRIALKLKPHPIKKESIDFLIKLVSELSNELGEFSFREFNILLDEIELDPDRREEFIELLRENGIIYEPKPGKFRLIQ